MFFVLSAAAGAVLALVIAHVMGFLGRGAQAGRQDPGQSVFQGIRADLEDVVEALPIGGLLVGDHDEVLKVNGAGAAMGLTRGTRVGFPGLLERVRQARRSGTAVVLEQLPGAETAHLASRVLPLHGGLVLVMAEDETAVRRMDAVRRDFVANISHELKTPIGAIGILAETIEAAAGDPEQVSHFTRRLQRESARLGELVSQIIELSRLQSSDPMLSREVVDVEEIVDEAVARTRASAEGRGVSLIRTAMPPAWVLGDRWQLMDAVVNLVQNAINYSDENARVAVAVAQVHDEDADWVEIKVTDNGIGISLEDQERIFERFYRVDYGRSRESGGTGLGLSLGISPWPTRGALECGRGPVRGLPSRCGFRLTWRGP